LMMTATLPPSRKKALEDVCKRRGGLLCTVKGAEEREKSKRYQLYRSDEAEAWQTVHEVLNNVGKVLWVCNTIGRAMEIVEKAIGENLPVQPFHSRYRYKDRLSRQREVLDGFLPGQPAMFAVTTQVAEMSLDISADLLVTEYALIAALIQRLGRLNRFEDIPSQNKKALFIQPPNGWPYAKNKEEEAVLWEKVESWLELVADGNPKSQRELAEAFVSVEEKENVKDEILHCDWIDFPWMSLAVRKSWMEDGYTIDVVRQEDLNEGRLDEMVIPMLFPKGNSLRLWDRKGRYLISPLGTITYDPFKGAKYADKEEQSSAWIF
jgi:CRISPR-associated endonuclease/helicase Cas3